MSALRLPSLAFACALTTFALAFFVARAERPATADGGVVPQLPTLATPPATMAIPTLSRVAALPTIRVRHGQRSTANARPASTMRTATSGTTASGPVTTSTPKGSTKGSAKATPKADPPSTDPDGGDVTNTDDVFGG